MTKIGRNEQCPCGSGKKYKHCCDRLDKMPLRSLPPEVMQMMRAQEAAEKIRVQQQGHGKGIISFESNGYRVVFVGNRYFWSKDWLLFPDFLMAYMKQALNPQWGQRESQNPNTTHPLFRWLRKFQDYKSTKNSTGRIYSGEMQGFIACSMYLSYALYLIAHHDQTPKALLDRLRDSKTFLPTFYETLAGGAFALAGFEIKYEETKKKSDPTPEFTVTSKTTRKEYKLEAKRKDSWKAETHDVTSTLFRQELVGYIRDKLHDASSKKLTNAIYWIELSLPNLTSKEAWLEIVKVVKATLREAESTMKIKGEPVVPAYVVVTNHTYLANEDIAGNPVFASLESFNMPDFVPYGQVEIEHALDAYDRHRDIFWAFDCLNIMGTIPSRFDGTPAELMDENGQPIKPLKIGDRFVYPDRNGNERTGIIQEISCDGSDMAWAVIKDDMNDTQNIIRIPLTEAEKLAASRHGEAIFGKPDVSSRLAEDDLFGLYNWLTKAHAKMSRQQSLKQLENHPLLDEYKKLNDADLRIRVCREHTKALYANRTKKQTEAKEIEEPA